MATLKSKQFHPMGNEKTLDYYRTQTLLGDGNLFENLWFEDHKKDFYGVTDIVDYMKSVNPFLEKSLNPDTKASLCKQIRRIMKKNFDLQKNNTSFVYCIDEAEVKYLVNVLLKEYSEKLVYSDVKNEMISDMLEKFYRVFG